MHRIGFLILFVSSSHLLLAQDFGTGILPSWVVSGKLSDKWAWTGKLESMQQAYLNDETADNYRYIRTDIQNFLNYRVNPYMKLAAGYQYRFAHEAEDSHRFIQQLSIVQPKRSFRLGHRVRTDQTVSSSRSTQLRLRYRLSLEKPLQGTTIDPKEFYLVGSVEPLFINQSGNSTFEARLSGSLGNNLSGKNKLELGFDLRVDEFEATTPDKRLWWTLSYYLSL